MHIFEKINLSNITKGFLAFAVLFVAKHFDSEMFLFPLVSLGCGCSSGGGDGGGDSGNSGNGSEASTSNGSVSNAAGDSIGQTGENSPGNNASGAEAGGSTGGTASGGSTGGSTPFLCTWDGKAFHFENDILFGKPTSVFPTKELGLVAYEQGAVIGDLYKIQNTVVPKGDSIIFQIKEVEPEESFIDHLSLLHVAYPKNGELVVNSNFEDFLVFDRSSLDKSEGIESQQVKDQNGTDISEKFAVPDRTQSANHIQVMQTGDMLEITAKVEDRNNPLYLLMGSHYRDWTLGDILENGNTSVVKNRIISVFSESHSVHAFVSGAVKVSGLVVLLGAIWIFGSVQSIFSSSATDRFSDTEKLANAFGVQTARADFPSDPYPFNGKNSLVVEYSDGETFHKIDVTQPRYYQKTLEATLIPSLAIQASGEVTLRVRATKKHHVTDLSFVAPKELLPFQVTTLGVTKAFHRREKRDYAKILNEKNSKTYLHTLSADIVDLEFGPVASISKKDQENEAYLMRAHGFYTPLSEESQRIAGDWVSKIDPEAREWLGGMYALNKYDEKNRTTVL